MDEKLLAALRAAVERVAAQRKALRRAAVLLRLYPEGLNFVCNVTIQGPGTATACLDASAQETVSWDSMAELTPERAIAIVDRICAKAHQFLMTEPPALLKQVAQ